MNNPPTGLLVREEYIEQAYLFKALQKRKAHSEPIQDMLKQVREEVLATTQLPKAIDFLLAEVRHVGTMGTAMKRLGHYFTPFQTFQAIAMDPLYDGIWQRWILEVRHQLGIVELADLIYVNSQHYRRKNPTEEHQSEPLFGDKEGRIALANRKKEPHYLFSALQRQLGYPPVPRPVKPDENLELIPKLLRTVERLEVRIKLLEEVKKALQQIVAGPCSFR